MGAKGYEAMAYLAQIPPVCIVHTSANSVSTWDEETSLNG
jgi:hypothetical protein